MGTDSSAPPAPQWPQPASTPAHTALKTWSKHKLPFSSRLTALFSKGWKIVHEKKNFLFYITNSKTRLIFQTILDCLLSAFDKSKLLNEILSPPIFQTWNYIFAKMCFYHHLLWLLVISKAKANFFFSPKFLNTFSFICSVPVLHLHFSIKQDKAWIWCVVSQTQLN